MFSLNPNGLHIVDVRDLLVKIGRDPRIEAGVHILKVQSGLEVNAEDELCVVISNIVHCELVNVEIVTCKRKKKISEKEDEEIDWTLVSP